MRKKLILHLSISLMIILSSMVLCSSFLFADPVDTPVLWSGNGHYYKLVRSELSWEQANTAAGAMSHNGLQGYLVTITSSEESNFIINNLGMMTNETFWTGGTQQWESGDDPWDGWQWGTGEIWSFENWDDSSAEEPNDDDGYEDGDEDFLQLRHTGYWNDLSDESNTLYYIVEFGGVGNNGTPAPLTPQDWVLKDLNIDELVALYGPTPEGFIKMLYDNILGRVPDDSGLDYWTGQLINMIFGGSRISEHFIFSDEFMSEINSMSNKNFIEFLYESLLSRTPDSEGFGDWLAYMDKGASRLDTLRAFMNNKEWADICSMFNVVP